MPPNKIHTVCSVKQLSRARRGGGGGEAPAIRPRSGRVVDKPREGRVVDRVPDAEHDMASIKVAVSYLFNSQKAGGVFVV